mmetsp:Transcript_14094/g.22466  ORF Transcript_14094/g.22466 Transcript_14094/m.22466 type:complete len:90 (-) Transcript_14094:283-552(-)
MATSTLKCFSISLFFRMELSTNAEIKVVDWNGTGSRPMTTRRTVVYATGRSFIKTASGSMETERARISPNRRRKNKANYSILVPKAIRS